MDKSTLEEQLSQPLQTKKKQFEKYVTFLTGYNGIFNITDKKKNRFYFAKSISDEDGYKKLIIPPGAYEKEKLNK